MNELGPRLSALAHPQRMALFRLLVRRYPDWVPAGEIAGALGLKDSTASVYLSALAKVELIARERIGTSLRYAVNLDAARAVMTDLFVDCCRGRSDLCPPLVVSPLAGLSRDGDPPGDSPLSLANRSLSMSDPHALVTPGPSLDETGRYDVLFICTGNSARSIFAEAILRNVASDRFRAHSAGTRPYSELNPIALEVLANEGHDTSLLRAKHVSEFQAPDATVMDFVFTVCDQAANEECPAWAGQPISAHWGQPDPVNAEGNHGERLLAFQRAYGALHNRISLFTGLPIASLNRMSLQKRVDEIGRAQDVGALS
ncbi:MAG: ArsR family transcriptional regulator [Pseudomonadota bacterium]